MTDPAFEAAWIPGRQISTWPELKYARGVQHVAALQARLQVWAAGSRVTTRKVISDDRLSVEIFVEVPHVLPLNELALDLGDAVHNLRSSLDAVVWDLSHLDGSAPTNPRQVAFPVCPTEKAWRQACDSQLASVPEQVRERIRLLQPFTAKVPGLSSIDVLHLADIRDKHRSQLRCSFTVQSISMDEGRLKFEEENAIPDPPFEMELHESGGLADGVKLMTIRSSARFESVHLPISIGLQIMIDTDTGEHELAPMLEAIVNQSRMALDIIYFGLDGALMRKQTAETPDSTATAVP